MTIAVRRSDRVVATCPNCMSTILRRSGSGVQVIGKSIVIRGDTLSGACSVCSARWSEPLEKATAASAERGG